MGGVLWTTEHMTQATHGVLHAPQSTQDNTPIPPITGMSIDSRSLSQGDAFIALVGDNFDGHDYVHSAHKAGASIAIVSQKIDCPIAQIVVPDTTQALIDLGQHRIQNSTAKIIAITGSVGKTGTKEGLAHILSAQGKTHATLGNLNNHLGLPLTMARMPLDTSYGIFELGMNHAGEMTHLSQMLNPHVAVITTIAPVHMEFFNSVADIATAKAEIWSGLAPNSPAIMPLNCPHHDILYTTAVAHDLLPVVCGDTAHCAVQYLNSTVTNTGSQVTITVDGKPINYTIGALGQNWIDNSLLMAGVLHAVGANVTDGMAQLATLTAPAGRGKITPTTVNNTPITVIDDSYNASITSMKNAIAIADSMPAKRRVAVLGCMLELGNTAPDYHQQVGDCLANSTFDYVYAIGDHAQHYLSQTQGEHFATMEQAIPSIMDDLQPDDLILVKGAHGSHVHTLIPHLNINA